MMKLGCNDSLLDPIIFGHIGGTTVNYVGPTQTEAYESAPYLLCSSFDLFWHEIKITEKMNVYILQVMYDSHDGV